MKIEYKEVKPGVVRLTSTMDILTPARCIEEANKILNSNNRGNLRYGDTPDLCDSLLLAQESMDREMLSVVFSVDGEDIIVNQKNIKEVSAQILSRIKVYEGTVGKNYGAIKDAVAELGEKY